MAGLPTGTVTFLFTDLEVSTRLWDQDTEAMRVALARHDELLRDAVTTHGGEVVKGRGDGVHAVFATAEEAIYAAIDAQLAMSVEPWVLSEPLRIRIGVHSGVAELRDGDYYGATVNRAARLEAAAHGGQIVCSQATADLVRDSLPPTIELVDLGEHALRDLSRPERIFQVLAAGLERDFAPLATLSSMAGNLPFEPNRLIGRADLVERIIALVADTAVVSLTGPGGVGKTRLALQVARRLQPEFVDGAWFVDLAPVDAPDRVAAVVAGTLGFKLAADEDEVTGLCTRLRRRRLLLVLDNCEHLVEPVASMVDAISTSTGNVRVIITSREGLGIPAERVQPVRPLATAADGEAVELFVTRARGARPDFTLDRETTPVVAELCRRLDGIPLAIELAAARTRSIAPSKILERLDERFRMLTGGSRTAVARHQTLQAAFDWSYDLLTRNERAVLDRLSVFAGSFPLDAAEIVAGDDEIDAFDVLENLGALVDKSLVVADPEEASYRLLETIREYAATRLTDSGSVHEVRARHAGYYRDLVTACAPELTGASDVATMARLTADMANLRLMLDWYHEHDHAEIVADLIIQLSLFWFWRGHILEMRLRLSATLDDLGDDHALRSRVHGVLAWMNANLGLEGIREHADRSAEQASLAEIPIPVQALNALATYSVISLGDTKGAIDRIPAVVEAAQEAGDHYWAIWAQLNGLFYRALLTPGSDNTLRLADDLRPEVERIGSVVLRQNLLTGTAVALSSVDLERSLSLLEDSCDIAMVENLREALAQAEFFRGLELFRSRSYSEAAMALRRALVGNLDMGNRRGMLNVLSAVTGVAERTGRFQAAAELLADLHAAREEYLFPGSEFERHAEEKIAKRLAEHSQHREATLPLRRFDLEATTDLALNTLDDIARDTSK